MTNLGQRENINRGERGGRGVFSSLRSPRTPWLSNTPDIRFWLILLLLNLSLFLPLYAFFLADMPPYPTGGTGWDWLYTLFIARANLDPWRLQLELIWLVTLWVYWQPRPKISPIPLFVILYLLIFVYHLYEGFVNAYYLLTPTWYHDVALFQNGFRYVLNSLNVAPVVYLLGLLVVAGIIWLLGRLFGLLLAPPTLAGLHDGSRWGLVFLLAGMSLGFLWGGVGLGGGNTAVVSSLTAKLASNFHRSQVAWQTDQQFTATTLHNFTEHPPSPVQTLATKPNIYLIFIESYGSVLYQREDYQRNYQTLLRRLEQELSSSGWHTVSTRSESPTWGGGSWLAYTSALTGIPITAHTQYLLLREEYTAEPVPNLGTYLHEQGYRTYSFSGNSDQIAPTEWQSYQQFYGMDEWWRLSDSGYGGPLYGWGPSMPDQYALGYVQEEMRAQGEPHFFFYITQNSHYPWHPLPPVVADWQELATLAVPELTLEAVPHAVLRQRYWRAIQRQLMAVTLWVQAHGRANDLYIIIGDHQPARVARYSDGWDTPWHIITQDPALAEAFLPHGFLPGLETATLTPAPRQHTDLYPLLTHVLLSQYGTNPAQAPPFP
jgi:hypothetical protein